MGRFRGRRIKLEIMMGFYWLLVLILYHPDGCDGLLALCLSVCLCSCDNDITTFKCLEPASVKSLVQLMPILRIVGLRYKQTSCAIVVRYMQYSWSILPSARCDDALAIQGLNVIADGVTQINRCFQMHITFLFSVE